MAVLELGEKPFFADKNRAFWNLHSAGWGGATALYAATGIANNRPLDFLLPVLISSVTGYSISLLLSVVFRNVINQRPLITWGATFFSVMLATMLYAYIDTWVVQTIVEGADQTPFAQLVLGALFKDGLLLGGWSALYYAINYFVRAEEQADQLLRLEAAATSAQLTMLRYQLNPHFLFNTLNSISTLVLLKQTEQANAMLSRLSSFLRFTLINEAEAKVTLSQEVETLKLYLDIEKMRFEERLRTEFDIDDDVTEALVPSLLLQPLVENAIKYAVTPQEDGADISINARRVGDRVRIIVADTGPGLQSSLPDPKLSTGVGMANTRERLLQAYGDDQRFDSYTRSGGGFEVVIEFPYQTKNGGGETLAIEAPAVTAGVGVQGAVTA
ncbi:sensor histidine kinase [Sphingorhabdus pulchriflava]|uniref:Sensor histidine kinase n=1 Tax=Sphingorhabdus pulchriflava TaxID=2292257 RepID=A0A371BJ01_9SPHN|nr:histidine kinase [Sphingorhabdus pulchriflava]RDV07584.1 sensor histidine kinase [Sphingorhabdus pulchriflava]